MTQTGAERWRVTDKVHNSSSMWRPGDSKRVSKPPRPGRGCETVTRGFRGKVNDQELLWVMSNRSWSRAKHERHVRSSATQSAPWARWRFNKGAVLESSRPLGLLVCDGECGGFRGRWGSRAGMPSPGVKCSLHSIYSPSQQETNTSAQSLSKNMS